MHRLLLIDIEGVSPSRQAISSADDLDWLPWLIEALRPWQDVRIVFHSMQRYSSAAPHRDVLGELASRVIGNTYQLPQRDALEATVRFNNSRVEHLLLVADSGELSAGQFNVFECDSEQGLCDPRAQEAVTAWLRKTAPAAGRPEPRTSRLLFLDFDGVLHPFNGEHEPEGWFRWLPILERALQSWSDVRIIVHSSWRYEYTDTELQGLLRQLGSRFVGTAPRGAREQAIETVLQANKGHVTAHLVLDDDPREFTRGRLNLLLCNGLEGLSQGRVQDELRAWLESTAPLASSGDSDASP